VSIFGGRDKVKKEEAEAESMTLLQLIQSRKWRKVRKILKSSNGEEIYRIMNFSGLSPIGACLGCNAPSDITEKILLLYPEALLFGDEYGSTPLHLACLNGSHPDLIEMILDQECGVKASQQFDCQKCSPLHLAVNYACAHIFDEKASTQSSQSKTNDDRVPSAWLHMNDDLYIDAIIRNSHRTIKMLCKVCPQMVLSPDDEGNTPLDILQEKKLTIINEVNYELLEELYEELLETAIRLYKEKKKRWENEGYREHDIKRYELDDVTETTYSEITTLTDPSQQASLDSVAGENGHSVHGTL